MKNERHIPGGDSHVQKEMARPPREAGQQNDHLHFSRIAFLEAIASKYPGNSAEAQRVRIVTAMVNGAPLNTIEARRWLDCPHPAQRILELREMGADILEGKAKPQDMAIRYQSSFKAKIKPSYIRKQTADFHATSSDSDPISET